ncbi:MAG: hypothetical protein RBU21_03530 [FCB group bacterium]|jgi:hypothetical protein|nr:hypothetical protein [FCB group bacterium]
MDMPDATPNSRLAAAIGDALVEEGVIREESRDAYFKKLCAGTLGASEWKLLAEKLAEAGNA